MNENRVFLHVLFNAVTTVFVVMASWVAISSSLELASEPNTLFWILGIAACIAAMVMEMWLLYRIWRKEIKWITDEIRKAFFG